MTPQSDGTIRMENGILRAVVNKDGTLASLRLLDPNRYQQEVPLLPLFPYST